MGGPPPPTATLADVPDSANPGRDAMQPPAALVRALLLVVAIVLLAAALLYNELTLAPLARDDFSALTRGKIRGVQAGFAVVGLACLAASELLRRRASVAARLSGRAPEILLFLLAGLLPFAVIDFGLRPFVVPKTSIFEEDRELGWRMRSNAVGEWGDVRVATNARGLRGPDLPYAKPAGVRRVLFLGDSVTFGYGVERSDDVFAFRAGRELAAALDAPVEVVNAAVGGYSPWQERQVLAGEGLRYAPDLLVVGFVLNDVTEKLALVRYGGSQRGWQLARTARGAVDRWLSASALATWLREGAAVLRFGRDVRLGAATQETAEVRRLVTEPARPEIRRGWSITLENLGSMLDTAASQRIPALLVVFPYAFQLESPRASAGPQRELARFARERGVPLLDLLPRFASEPAPERLLLDASHLSVEGHALAATAITEVVLARGLLSRPEPHE